MVIGIPNVGKSSLINSLRHLHLKRSTCSVTLQEIAFNSVLITFVASVLGKAAKVGPEAGVTRSLQMQIKVSSESHNHESKIIIFY